MGKVKLGSDICLCCDIKEMKILGVGGIPNVGKKGHFHNGYFCPKCKKVYYELANFGDVVHIFYTKKGTMEHLAYLNNKQRSTL